MDSPILTELAAILHVAARTDALAAPGLTIDDRKLLEMRRTSSRHALAHARRINDKRSGAA